jgi:rod shape-determining protein MreC
MRNLRLFIIRNYFFILFLLLQVISLSLLVNTNQHHHQAFMHSAGSVSGFILEQKNSVQQFFHLSEANRDLRQENARLKSLLAMSQYDTAKGVFLRRDSSLINQFEYLPATVIAGTVNKRNNYFTLNRGSAEGVQKNMGVISQNTIVGFVKDVSLHYCTVITVLNDKFTQSVRMPGNGEHGLVKWEGTSTQLVHLSGIPLDAPVKGGDTVVTRGTSGRFPEGQLVGTVYSVSRKQGSGHHYIQVKLSQPLNKVYHVYIVKNKFSREMNHLEAQLNSAK